MKGLFGVLALAAVSAGVFALGAWRRGSDGKPLLHVAKELPLTVSVANPERREIVQMVQAPGDVEAVREVEISSEIVAKIEEMPVEEGDQVRRADLLCRLNDDNLLAEVESGEARVARLRAAIAQAEADLEKAERDYQRQLRLAEQQATSANEMFDYLIVFKKAKALLDMRQHELVESEAFLQRVREDLKRTIITSPIDGVVSKVNAKAGEVVVTGTMNNPGTVIMTVSDLSKMQVRAKVDEVDAPLVQAGQPARAYLQSDPQKAVPARVVRVASKGTKELGRDVVTFETLLEVLSDDPRIKPAMTTNVEIEVARHADAVTVPVEAVVHRMRKDLPEAIVRKFDALQADLGLSDRARQAQYIKVLYVMDEDVARVRLVHHGIADTRWVEVREGVDVDDVVIVGPYRSLDQLKDGRKVALAPEEEKKKLAAGSRTQESESGTASSSDQDASQGKDQQMAAGGSP